MITKERFKKLSAFHKGYIVYMFGMRDDEPNVPSEYRPRKLVDREKYKKGQQAAIMHVQDSP